MIWNEIKERLGNANYVKIYEGREESLPAYWRQFARNGDELWIFQRYDIARQVTSYVWQLEETSAVRTFINS